MCLCSRIKAYQLACWLPNWKWKLSGRFEAFTTNLVKKCIIINQVRRKCPRGIPHGVHLRTSNPQTATRPRLQVPPTAMLYAPSPIRLHDLGCPILEQTTGWDSQHIVFDIFQDTPGCPLAVPVPRSTHLTRLLSQPIPSAHINPRKKAHTQMTLPIYPHHPPGRLY